MGFLPAVVLLEGTSKAQCNLILKHSVKHFSYLDKGLELQQDNPIPIRGE